MNPHLAEACFSEVVILKQYISGAIVPENDFCWTQILFQVGITAFVTPAPSVSLCMHPEMFPSQAQPSTEGLVSGNP
jgi:hypothetical protein